MSKDFNNPRGMPLHRQRGVATAEVTVSCYYLEPPTMGGSSNRLFMHGQTGLNNIEDLTE